MRLLLCCGSLLALAGALPPADGALRALARGHRGGFHSSSWGCRSLLPVLLQDSAAGSPVLLRACLAAVGDAGACAAAEAVLSSEPQSPASIDAACRALEGAAPREGRARSTRSLLQRQAGPGGYKVTAGVGTARAQSKGHSLALEEALARKGANYDNTPREALPPFRSSQVPDQFADVVGDLPAAAVRADWNHEREDSQSVWQGTHAYSVIQDFRAQRCGTWPVTGLDGYGCSQSHKSWWKLSESPEARACAAECGARVTQFGILCCFVSKEDGCWMKPGATAVEYATGGRGGGSTTCADDLPKLFRMPLGHAGDPSAGARLADASDPGFAKGITQQAEAEASDEVRLLALRRTNLSALLKDRAADVQRFRRQVAEKLSDMSNSTSRQEARSGGAERARQVAEQEAGRLDEAAAAAQRHLDALAGAPSRQSEDSASLAEREQHDSQEAGAAAARLARERDAARDRATAAQRAAAAEREAAEAQRRLRVDAEANLSTAGARLEEELSGAQGRLRQAAEAELEVRQERRYLQRMGLAITGHGGDAHAGGGGFTDGALELEEAADEMRDAGGSDGADGATVPGGAITMFKHAHDDRKADIAAAGEAAGAEVRARALRSNNAFWDEVRGDAEAAGLPAPARAALQRVRGVLARSGAPPVVRAAHAPGASAPVEPFGDNWST